MSATGIQTTRPLLLVANPDGWQRVEANGVSQTIPQGWDVPKVGEEIRFSIGHTPTKDGDNYNGSINWVTISNLDGGSLVKRATAKILKSRTRILPEGSLVGSFKMTVGRFSILDFPSATNEAIVGAAPDDAPRHDLNYLRRALVGPFNEGATINGQGVKLLNTKTINRLDFVAPPKPEQQLISAVLSTQEAQIEDLRALRDAEKQRLSWLTEELLSGRVRVKEKKGVAPVVVTRDGEGEPKETLEAFELVANADGWQQVEMNGEISRVPKNWTIKRISDLAEIVTGSTPSTQNSYYWTNERTGTPWFSTPDLRRHIDGVVTETGKKLTIAGSKITRTCPEGTVMVSCIATIGEVAIAGATCAFNQQINGILPNNSFHPHYLRNAISNNRRILDKMAAMSVVRIIKKSSFGTFSVALPDIHEQTRIVSVLSVQERQISDIDSLIAVEQQRLEWLTEELLSGRIRVIDEASINALSNTTP